MELLLPLLLLLLLLVLLVLLVLLLVLVFVLLLLLDDDDDSGGGGVTVMFVDAGFVFGDKGSESLNPLRIGGTAVPLVARSEDLSDTFSTFSAPLSRDLWDLEEANGDDEDDEDEDEDLEEDLDLDLDFDFELDLEREVRSLTSISRFEGPAGVVMGMESLGTLLGTLRAVTSLRTSFEDTSGE